MEIAVIMTCHNRRELTRRCIGSLVGQPLFKGEHLFLVDDGSSDGTGDMVRAMLPDAHVIAGSGDLFWNGGMRLAWDHAVAAAPDFDYYLWLNDDVELRPDAIAALLADADAVASVNGAVNGAVIIAGSTVDPDGTVNYGGHRRPSMRRPLRLTLVEPDGTPQAVYTVSGNVVLVSRAAERILGNLNPAFEHIYGDLDYGYRAAAGDVPVFLASRVAGMCGTNSVAGSSLDRSMSRIDRLRRRRIEDGKVHARDWRRFAALYSGLGPLSLLYGIAPYVRILFGRSG